MPEAYQHVVEQIVRANKADHTPLSTIPLSALIPLNLKPSLTSKDHLKAVTLRKSEKQATYLIINGDDTHVSAGTILKVFPTTLLDPKEDNLLADQLLSINDQHLLHFPQSHSQVLNQPDPTGLIATGKLGISWTGECDSLLFLKPFGIPLNIAPLDRLSSSENAIRRLIQAFTHPLEIEGVYLGPDYKPYYFPEGGLSNLTLTENGDIVAVDGKVVYRKFKDKNAVYKEITKEVIRLFQSLPNYLSVMFPGLSFMEIVQIITERADC